MYVLKMKKSGGLHFISVLFFIKKKLKFICLFYNLSSKKIIFKFKRWTDYKAFMRSYWFFTNHFWTFVATHL